MGLQICDNVEFETSIGKPPIAWHKFKKWSNSAFESLSKHIETPKLLQAIQS